MVSSWLKSFARAVLRDELKKLEGELENYKTLYNSCLQEKRLVVESLTECREDKEKLENRLVELQKDLDYFRERTEKLMSALAEAVEIPDIKEYVKSRVLVKPYELKAFEGYDLLVADLEYYAFPKKNWESILTLVHQQVKKILKGWREEIADCDNYSMLTCTIAYLAFDKAGLDRQGALSMAWSMTHAYNLYVPSDDLRCWLYEPQTNSHVGILSRDAVETYRTWGIWFMGKKV